MNRQVIEEREHEIKGLQGQLSEYHSENVRVKKEIVSVREELRQFKQISDKLSNEKKDIYDEK
jgi:predicted RNase H-like nuclease (RuvC/YqgF family)